MTKSWMYLLALVLSLSFGPAYGAGGGGEETGSDPTKPKYLELKPAFVVNLQDGKRMRFMQIKVQVMARDQEVLDALEEHMPPVRDTLIMLFTHQDLEAMRSVQGREAVREQALADLQGVLEKQAGVVGPEAVYFTDFVIQ